MTYPCYVWILKPSPPTIYHGQGLACGSHTGSYRSAMSRKVIESTLSYRKKIDLASRAAVRTIFYIYTLFYFNKLIILSADAEYMAQPNAHMPQTPKHARSPRLPELHGAEIDRAKSALECAWIVAASARARKRSTLDMSSCFAPGDEHLRTDQSALPACCQWNAEVRTAREARVGERQEC